MRIRGRYRVVELLGQGGMGAVFRVVDERADREVPLALKVVWPGSSAPEFRERLRQEFSVLATLRDPRLMTVHDFGRVRAGIEWPGLPDTATSGVGYFMTREFVAGRELGDVVEEEGRSLGAICELLAQAARGLHRLHVAGLRHGDLKPANVIVSDDGSVRLIDFGLTVPIESGRRWGTAPYLSPEVLAGEASDHRSDLYALGVCLFELATGELPSGERTGSDLLSWHSSRERPPFATARPDAPASLSDLADRLIARDHRRRPPNAAEVATWLVAAADELGPATRFRRPGVLAPSIVIDTGTAERLWAACADRLGGRGGPAVIALTGVAGSGRTAALRELSWRAEIDGVEVVSARGATATGAGFTAALAEVADIVGVDFRAPVQSSPLEFAAVAQFLADASKRWPMIVVADDFDFAADDSRRLVDYLAHGLPDDARVAIVAAVSDSARAVEVSTEPLDRRQIGDALEVAAGRRDPELAARVFQHTAGHLLHVVDTLNVLAEGGFPPAETLDALALPPRLAEVEALRLSALGDDVRAVCDALAVLARPVPADDVAALVLAAGIRVDVEAAIDAAVAAEVVAPVARSGDVTRFDFARPATRLSAYRRLEPDRAARMQRAAAERPGCPVWERARHLARAGDGDAVAASAVDAVSRCATELGAAAALSLGEELLAVIDEPSDALVTAVAQVAHRAGRPQRSLSLLAARLRSQPSASALAIAAVASSDVGDNERAESLFRALLATAAEPEHIALAIRELSRLCVRLGRLDDADAVATGIEVDSLPQRWRDHIACARAYAKGTRRTDPAAENELSAIAERAAGAGDHELAAIASHYLGYLRYRRGDYEGTRTAYREALGHAENSGDVVRAGTLRMNLAAMSLSFGEYGDALHSGLAAASLLRAAGARSFELIANKNLGHLLLELGDYAQSEQALLRARDLARELGSPVHEIGTEQLLGLLAARRGDALVARELLAAAAARFGDRGDERRRAEALLDLAEVECDVTGDIDAADLALAEVGAHDDIGRRARHAAMSARVLSERDPERAAAEAAQVTTLLADHASQIGAPLSWQLHRHVGLAREDMGDRDAARTHRSAALAIMRGLAADLPPYRRVGFWRDTRRSILRDRERASSLSQLSSLSIGQPGDGDARQLSERLFRLTEIYQRLYRETDRERLLETVVDVAADLVGARRGFLLLERGGALEHAASKNLSAGEVSALGLAASPDGVDAPRSYSRTIASRAFESGELIVADVSADAELANAASVHALRIERAVCAPVRARGKVIGALYLEHSTAAPSEDELRLLVALADQAAVIILEFERKAELARKNGELAAALLQVESLLSERDELLGLRTQELAVARRDLSDIGRLLGADRAHGIVGSSDTVTRAIAMAERVGPSDLPVLITGESGTGKELFARAVHNMSPRADHSFVAVHCAGVPDGALESELFGHVRGAFTGATRDRRGLFEVASGGTLLFDEVAEMSPRMQASLLRALAEGVVTPVGSNRDVRVDVRVLGSTQHDLEALAESGAFRQDLFYRLHVVRIEVPPLRARRGDIPALVDHFLTQHATRTGTAKKTATRAALAQLCAAPWPGNVRQLMHAVIGAAVLAEGTELEPGDFAELSSASAAASPSREARADAERDRIVMALEQASWNKTRAAEALGMPRRTFYRRLKEYGIR